MEDSILGFVEIVIIAFIIFVFWYAKHSKNKKQAMGIKIKKKFEAQQNDQLKRSSFINEQSDTISEFKIEKSNFTDKEIDYYVTKEINKRTEEHGYLNSINNIIIPAIDLSKRDPMFEEAARLIVASQKASTSDIQRKFSIGFNRAGRIVDQLEIAGIIGPNEGIKARQVMVKDDIHLDQILKLLGSDIHVSEREIYFNEHILPSKIDFIEKKVQEIIKQKEEQKEAKLKEDIKQQLLKKEKERKEKSRVQVLEDQVRKEMIERGELLNDFSDTKRREPIPQDVQDRVWNRDGGRCVKCGSKEKLEFDHIIPFSKGGSNAYRNLQILCEKCNRQKHNNIG